MGKRTGVLVTRKLHYDGPPAPNQTRDVITIQIRMAFPPNAVNVETGRRLLLAELFDAYGEACREVEAHFLRP
jgi:hypothetical protein